MLSVDDNTFYKDVYNYNLEASDILVSWLQTVDGWAKMLCE